MRLPKHSLLRTILVGIVSVALMVFVPASDAQAVPANSTQIISVWTNHCLDSSKAGDAYTLACNKGNNQYWKGSTAHPYEIIDYATGLCLTINDLSNIYTDTCHNYPNQRWTFTGPPGLGTIQSVYTSECLSVTSTGNVTGAVCRGAGTQTGWREPTITFGI